MLWHQLGHPQGAVDVQQNVLPVLLVRELIADVLAVGIAEESHQLLPLTHDMRLGVRGALVLCEAFGGDTQILVRRSAREDTALYVLGLEPSTPVLSTDLQAFAAGTSHCGRLVCDAVDLVRESFLGLAVTSAGVAEIVK